MFAWTVEEMEREEEEEGPTRPVTLCNGAGSPRRPSHPCLQMILASHIEPHPTWKLEYTAAHAVFVFAMLPSSLYPLLTAETVPADSDSSRAGGGIVYGDHWMRRKIGRDVSVRCLERYVLLNQ